MYNENSHTNIVSDLYHLQPIGIGTPYVESLTSYIKRLAQAHCVSPGNLLRKEIIPCINKSYLKSNHFIGDGAKNINALSSDITNKIVNILEEKTCIDNLTYLTTITWKEFINCIKISRKTQAWCPICYNESKQLKQPVYEQLIWNFSSVKICQKHNVKLVEKCPYCGCEYGNFYSLSRVGFCNRCNTWLGLENYENNKISTTSEDWNNWVYNNIGQLLTIFPTFERRNKLQFSDNIKSIINLYNMSMRRLGNEININHEKIRYWISGGKPSLNDILALSYRFGYSVDYILTKDINIINKEIYNRKIITQKKNSKNKTDMNELKKKMDEAIATNKVLSLKKLSTNYKMNSSTIKKYFPEEVNKLKESNDKCLKNCKLRKQKLIKDTMKSLYDNGIFPSRKSLTREFGKRTVINDDERKVWVETLEKLGCTSEDYDNGRKK